MDERPNPDELLRTIEEEEELATKGKLKIFFGYAAGVGKTYAMLDAARQIKKSGVDVVIGYVEPHTRPETTALLEGLERIPNLEVPYRGIILKEFNLDLALKRNPKIIIVDELAHSNAESMRHKKRFNDIEELLNAGIDVYTTVNVQHIESLNDQIAALTGIFVRETIPDAIFDTAQHVELIDIEPNELISRLNAGKIYKSTQAHKAITNFFTTENLIALREIALRRTADRVNREFETVKSKNDLQANTSEQILVCISNSPTSPKVIRTAARMAEAFHAPLLALYVERNDSVTTELENHNLRKNVRLSEQLGAKVVSIYGEDTAKQIAEYAQINGITKIIIGRHQGAKRFAKKNVVDKLLELSPRIDVYVIPDSIKVGKYKNVKIKKGLPQFQFSIKDMIISLGILIVATIMCALFDSFGFPESSIITVYILGVLITSRMTTGHWYGIASSLISVLLFNFFFTVPRYTFNAYEAQYSITFPIMLASAIITSTLTTRLQRQVEASEIKEKRTEVLFETTQKLLQAKGEKEISQIAIERIVKLFGRDVVMYLPDGEKIQSVDTKYKQNNLFAKDEQAVAHWVYVNNKEAGAGTNTLPGSKGYYIPIKGTHEFFAVLGIDTSEFGRLSLNQKSLLSAVIAQVMLAFEKEALYQIQQTSKMEIERERLKSNLLRAISHDLRTPLTIISGSTATLLSNNKTLTEDIKKELLQNIYNDSQWLINLVENLLSISRIDDGNIKLNKKTEAVEEVIEEALTHVNNRNMEHNIILDIPEELIEINVDAKLIEQVIINIIDNAIKYTKSGTEIKVIITKEISNVKFEISDNGKGLDEKDIAHIFDMFYTANKKSDSERGLGLGLSLCKSIVSAHGGEISVKNNKYGGATFYFYIPLK